MVEAFDAMLAGCISVIEADGGYHFRGPFAADKIAVATQKPGVMSPAGGRVEAKVQPVQKTVVAQGSIGPAKP